MKIKIEQLGKNHSKQNFECGIPMLDSYIRSRASQDVKRDLSACFVLIEDGSNIVAGYYTLSSNSITRDSFPAEMIARLPPSYADLPTILLGRLAVDRNYQGRRFGETLLMDALNQCVEIAQKIGVLAVVVDPIDTNAAKFYRNYGFIALPGSEKMFITIKTIEESL